MKVKGFVIRWQLIVLGVIGLATFGAGITVLLAPDIIPFIFDRPPGTAIVTRVIDGDTIIIEGGHRVRYIGIDTPETSESFFEEATAKNYELVLGKKVRLEKDVSETDRYGRLLRYVYVDDLFVNAELVRLGYAKEAEYPPDIKYRDYFQELGRYAALAELGMYKKPSIEVPLYRPPSPPKEKPTRSYKDILRELQPVK